MISAETYLFDFQKTIKRIIVDNYMQQFERIIYSIAMAYRFSLTLWVAN